MKKILVLFVLMFMGEGNSFARSVSNLGSRLLESASPRVTKKSVSTGARVVLRPFVELNLMPSHSEGESSIVSTETALKRPRTESLSCSSNAVCGTETSSAGCSSSSGTGTSCSSSSSSCGSGSGCIIGTSCSSSSLSCSSGSYGTSSLVGGSSSGESSKTCGWCTDPHSCIESIPISELPSQHINNAKAWDSTLCLSDPTDPKDENDESLGYTVAHKSNCWTSGCSRVTRSRVNRDEIQITGSGGSSGEFRGYATYQLSKLISAIDEVLSPEINPEEVICDMRNDNDSWWDEKHQRKIVNLSKLTPRIREEISVLKSRAEKTLARISSLTDEEYKKEILKSDPRSRRLVWTRSTIRPGGNEYQQDGDPNRAIALELRNAAYPFNTQLQKWVPRVTYIENILEELSTNREHNSMMIPLTSWEEDWEKKGLSHDLVKFVFHPDWEKINKGKFDFKKATVLDVGTWEKTNSLIQEIKDKYGLSLPEANARTVPAIKVTKVDGPSSDPKVAIAQVNGSYFKLEPSSIHDMETFENSILVNPSENYSFLSASGSTGAPATSLGHHGLESPFLSKKKTEESFSDREQDKSEIKKRDLKDAPMELQKKRQVLFFHTSTCSPCKKMENEYLSSYIEESKAGVLDYDIVSIDLNEPKGNEKYLKHIAEQDPYPKTVILEDGNEIKSFTGYMPEKQFLEFVAR